MSTEMITKFVMLVGLPAAGKSTYAKSLVENGFEWVSSDNLREELFNNVNACSSEENQKVFKEMENRTLNFLNSGISVCYDATNLNAKKRERLLSKLPDDIYKQCVVIVPPYETCLERNSKRERIVPNKVMDRMIKSFDPPSYEEGWDMIRIINEQSELDYAYSLLTILEKLVKIPHDNPHHSLTIGEHMLRAAELYADMWQNNEKKYSHILDNAIRFHDIGKGICKSFYDYHGRKTKTAHYYNHDAVSSYVYLSYSAGANDDLTTALLIRYHMCFFNGEKYVQKLRKKFGEVFYQNLLILNKCDVAAH